jgi:hypothetical protein
LFFCRVVVVPCRFQYDCDQPCIINLQRFAYCFEASKACRRASLHENKWIYLATNECIPSYSTVRTLSYTLGCSREVVEPKPVGAEGEGNMSILLRHGIIENDTSPMAIRLAGPKRTLRQRHIEDTRHASPFRFLKPPRCRNRPSFRYSSAT